MRLEPHCSQWVLPQRDVLDPIHYPPRFGDGGRGPGWAGPRARVPLGEAVEGSLQCACRLSPSPTGLSFQENPKGRRSWMVSQESQAGKRGDDLSQNSALVKPCARCFTALICQISSPFVAYCTSGQHPEGTDHLATVVHDLGPQLWAERFLQEAPASFYR